MGNLLTSLYNATNAITVFDRALSVVQNNIVNASTPGYARQDQSFVAAPFDPEGGQPGGVLAGPDVSARSEYVEQQVRSENQLYGFAQQQASDLSLIAPQFSLQDKTGISGALSSFFNSFSQLSVSPNDPVARQAVITQAGQVAQNFNQAAVGLSTSSDNIRDATRSTIDQINQLATQVASLNAQYRTGTAAAQDPGLDAQMHATLEQLSGLANVSLVRNSDGATDLYLAGQTPLVVGDKSFVLQGDFSGSQVKILDANGTDQTQAITGGSLGGLLDEENRLLPGYQNGLNQLASGFADKVNAALAQGVDQNGNAPTTNLFKYDQASDAAFSLSVTNIQASQIAAASAGAPGGNGNALALTQLANAQTLNGFTFQQFYGNLGGQVGNDLKNAQQDQSQYQDLLNQAKQLRTDQTGVSLDTEAAKLLQYQQSYNAVAKLVSTLSDLTQTLMNALTTTTG